MRLASITLSSNREGIIGDALRSVIDWVDGCLILDLGITDGTLDLARSIVGEKLLVVDYDWSLGGTAAAMRNYGLDAAARLGFDWAVTLDTDERIEPEDCLIRLGLATTQDDCIEVLSKDGSYAKERFFRLPFADRFVGCAHERVIAKHCKKSLLTCMCFDELPKTREQLRTRALGCLPALEYERVNDPMDPRWAYYVGDALEYLDRDDEAHEAFLDAMRLDPQMGWWFGWAWRRLIALEQKAKAAA